MMVSSTSKAMVLPLLKRIVGADGAEVREIVVPKGTNVTIAILGTNTNPDIWGRRRLRVEARTLAVSASR